MRDGLAGALVLDSSLLDVLRVEPGMRRFVLLSGLLGYVLIVVTGCSSSSSQPAQIDGMTPAEYREKAEPSQKSPPKKTTTAAPR
jgi:hypothetical protein